jgi:hypothetical protein
MSPVGVLFTEHPHYRAAAHVTIFSINNWLACGIGFAFAGSAVLVRGLIASPREYAARVIRSRGSTVQDVSYAENKADALVGVSALILGFAIQAVTAVAMTGHAAGLSHGGSYLVAIGWVAVPVILVLIADRIIRWPRMRSYLIEIAYYPNMTEDRQQYPSAFVLENYGRVLGKDKEKRTAESPELYFWRVWKVKQTRPS